MDDITKIVNSLKESGLLVKGVRETIIYSGFLSKLIGTLGARFS